MAPAFHMALGLSLACFCMCTYELLAYWEKRKRESMCVHMSHKFVLNNLETWRKVHLQLSREAQPLRQAFLALSNSAALALQVRPCVRYMRRSLVIGFCS